MKITLDLPDEYLAFLPGKEAEIAEVISAGLRVRKERIQRETSDLQSVVEFLSGLPSPEEVLALRASGPVVERSTALMTKSKDGVLTAEEQAEWDEIMRVEHLVRTAKARALAKMKADPRAA